MNEGGITARLSLFFRMVDEGVVSFSVAASFLAAVPLCAIQGSWLAEWSFDLFFATWILASLAAYPFVCALLNAYFLAALPVDRERMAASGRMETATIVAGAFGLLCAACLTDSSRMETVSTAGRTFVGAGMLACLFWYATARVRSKSAASPGSEAMAALSALIVSSTTFGLVCTVGTGLVWKILVLMYPLNLLLVLAKLAKGSKDAEAGLSNMRRRFRR